MIRHDKITFLISTLENVDLYKTINYDSYVNHDIFEVSYDIERFFKRLGVVSKNNKKTSQFLTEYLPVNKHDFLRKVLLRFTSDICYENFPKCNDCFFDICCDFYNKKNDWSE